MSKKDRKMFSIHANTYNEFVRIWQKEKTEGRKGYAYPGQMIHDVLNDFIYKYQKHELDEVLSKKD